MGLPVRRKMTDLLDVGSGQVTVKEGRDGLFKLPDMTVVMFYIGL